MKNAEIVYLGTDAIKAIPLMKDFVKNKPNSNGQEIKFEGYDYNLDSESDYPSIIESKLNKIFNNKDTNYFVMLATNIVDRPFDFELASITLNNLLERDNVYLTVCNSASIDTARIIHSTIKEHQNPKNKMKLFSTVVDLYFSSPMCYTYPLDNYCLPGIKSASLGAKYDRYWIDLSKQNEQQGHLINN